MATTRTNGRSNGRSSADHSQSDAAPSMRPDFQVVGQTGLRRFSGWIYEDFLPELQGYRGRQVYREMSENDPVIGGILFAIEMLIRRVDWRVDPGDDSSEAEQDAEFVDSCRNDMENSWPDLLSEILTMLPFGFSLHEVLLKRRIGPYTDDPLKKSKFDDGLIGWRGLPGRAQETVLHWNFDDEGTAVEMVQLSPPDYRQITIPLSKCLNFRTTTRKNNPEGRSVIRNAYLPWFMGNNIARIEAIGIERDLAGYPIAKVPPEILASSPTPENAAMLAAVKAIVTNIRRDEQEGTVWPLLYDDKGNEMYKLELLSTGGARVFDTDKIVTRYDQRKAMVVLADFILLGHENVGSKALSQDKTDMFADAITAWLDVICEHFNTRAIPQLLALNGRAPKTMPKLAHGTVESVDIQKLGAYMLALSQAGAPLFPNDELLPWLMEQAGAPAPPENQADLIAKQQQDEQRQKLDVMDKQADIAAKSKPTVVTALGSTTASNADQKTAGELQSFVDFFTDKDGEVHPIGDGAGGSVGRPVGITKVDASKSKGSGVGSKSSGPSSPSPEHASKSDVSTTGQHESLALYTENGYSAINSGLRGGGLNGEDQAHVDNIDKVIASSSLDKATTVYRGISTSFLERDANGKLGIQNLNLKPGTVLNDKAFMSTSTDKSVADRFAAKGNPGSTAILQISLPAGAKAYDGSKGSHADEREMLLGRNTSIRVTSVSGNIVHAELVHGD